MELYTAVGKLCRKNEQYGLLLKVGGRELIADPQESTIWMLLNWGVYPKEVITPYCFLRRPELKIQRSYEDCIDRMVQRGMIAKGSGSNPLKAYYQLFSDLYILPMFAKNHTRLRAAFGLLGKCPIKEIFRMARPLVLEDLDKIILQLIYRTCLSTAEIVAYLEKILSPYPEEGENDHLRKDVAGIIYDGEDTAREAILFKAAYSSQCIPVVTSINRLYKQRAIIFDLQ